MLLQWMPVLRWQFIWIRGRNDNQLSPAGSDCTAVYPSQKRTASRLIKQLGQFKVDAWGRDPSGMVGCSHILDKTFTYLNRKESMAAFQYYLSCKEIQCYWDVHFDGPRFLPSPLLSSLVPPKSFYPLPHCFSYSLPPPSSKIMLKSSLCHHFYLF